MAEEKKSAGRKTGLRKKNTPASAAKTGKKSASTASRKTKSKKTRKNRKPKVVLSTRKVVAFCACVCCFCALFLGLSVVLNSMPEETFEDRAVSVKNAEKSSDAKESTKAEHASVKSELPKSVPARKADSIQKPDVKKEAASAKASSPKPSVSAQRKAAPSAEKKTAGPKQNPAAAESKKAAPAKAVSPKNAASPSKPAPAKPSVSKSARQTSSVKKTEQPAPAQKAGSVQKSAPAKAPEKKSSYVASAAGQKQNENAQSQALKNPRFDIPGAVNGATIVIVIDDAGRSVENVKKYASLPFPLTIAVLPRLEHSRDCAQVSISLGKEVILHQPMQSINHKLDPGPGKITVDMSFSEIADVISENLASLGPGVKGMNNHEGSEVTGDVIRIGAVLDACQKHGIYFLDSRTTAATKAPQAALERDMRIYEKAGPYLDNDLTREKMTERMYETLRYANNHGRAVVIGHVDKSVKILPDLLAEMYPYMKAAGYRFATPSTLR